MSTDHSPDALADAERAFIEAYRAAFYTPVHDLRISARLDAVTAAWDRVEEASAARAALSETPHA